MIKRIINSTIGAAKGFAKSNKIIAPMLYSIANKWEFSSLLEHEKMLADSVRVDHYHDAIQRNIRPGDVVIDLGTGTGILAIMAARCGARVHAIDHSDFISVAKRVAESNGIDSINFVNVNSRRFSLAEKADFIIHEQMGDDLFNENMIDNLLDLKRRALKPTGKILPGVFELFLEPVAIKKEYRVPYIWEIDVHGVRFASLRNAGDIKQFKPRGYGRHFVDAASLDYFLCDPEPVLRIDLNEVDDPEEIPKRLKAIRSVARAGGMDGFCLYFRVIFDSETQFDTSPGKAHWANRLFRTPRKEYRAGEKITFSVEIEDLRRSYTWSFSLEEGGAFEGS